MILKMKNGKHLSKRNDKNNLDQLRYLTKSREFLIQLLRLIIISLYNAGMD